MSPQSTVMPENQIGPVSLLCPPVNTPSVAPLESTAGEFTTYGFEPLPVP